jgi:hypothetical protein
VENNALSSLPILLQNRGRGDNTPSVYTHTHSLAGFVTIYAKTTVHCSPCSSMPNSHRNHVKSSVTNNRGIIIYGKGNTRECGAVIVASSQTGNRDRIFCKRIRSPGIDSKESIPPAYEAWRTSTTNMVVVTARPATYYMYVVHKLVESIPGLLKR